MKNKIIIALDTDDLNKAKKLVKTLHPRAEFFKIGLEFINTGKAPELIRFINKLGGKVFYDIKLNDIPETMRKAAKVISKLGVWGFTVHASAGKLGLRAAVSNKGRSKIIGVTVLTSQKTNGETIKKYGRILAREGADGFVCSANEALELKKFGKIIITPGIRPKWAKRHDQKRISTPAEAIQNGADHLVIGRPITEARNISEALRLVIEEIEKSGHGSPYKPRTI